MTLQFSINYRTEWGENIFVVIDGSEEIALTHRGDGLWTGTASVNDGPCEIAYSYLVRHADGSERREWGAPRTVALPPRQSVALVDRWHDRPAFSPFCSSAFTECFFRSRNIIPQEEPDARRTLTIRVQAPEVDPMQTMLICGSTPALGEWDLHRAIEMAPQPGGFFAATIPMPDAAATFKVCVRAAGQTLWESGPDRAIAPSSLPSADNVIVEASPFVTPLPLWRGAGVAIPVFSLRSDNDWGIGDFADIRMMADWASATGQKIIQLLPVNDTTMTGTWADSYPYNAISTFALHPAYLRPEEAGMLQSEEEMESFRQRARELNALPQVDYEAAFRLKADYTRKLYAQTGAATAATDSYRSFVADNSDWLQPYAAFCLLRDRFHTSDMSQWGEYATYDADKICPLLRQNADEAGYYIFVQYHLDRQLRQARDYCHTAGIALKGDIPIGISRTSVDAWLYPELFNLDTSAGAPPDDFAILGQNWGFPTYNWNRMSADGFAWWKDRFRKMSQYFDAYRIDHVLGFFRIWQIPLDAIHGLLGVFYPALPLSVDEMRFSFDFRFDPAMTRPFITDPVLAELFGELADRVRREFLTPCDPSGRYSLRATVDTQRKVARHFRDLPDDGDNNRIYNGLLRLIDDVLFIADPEQADRYHPRIAARDTFAYAAMTDDDRRRFDRMYEDFYYHRSDSFWKEKALWKLPPLIDSTAMLCCAEDLGMIPPCVPSVMDELEILSLKVQRMPSEPGHEFGDTSSYPYYSVCTTSTHDMGGIRQWWEEERERTQRYFNTALRLRGQAPYYAEPWICDRIVTDHLLSPSMLCILPLQDWLSIDGNLRRHDPREEQINDPANPANNWNYRMHITLEQLLDQRHFAARLRRMIAAAGRA